eukprot:437324_1
MQKLIKFRYFTNYITTLIDANNTIKINTILFPINVGYPRGLSELDVAIHNSWPGSTARNLKHETKIFYTSLGYLIAKYLSNDAFEYKNKFDFTKGNEMKKWKVKNRIIQHIKETDCLKLENAEIYQHARLYILGKLVV